MSAPNEPVARIGDRIQPARFNNYLGLIGSITQISTANIQLRDATNRNQHSLAPCLRFLAISYEFSAHWAASLKKVTAPNGSGATKRAAAMYPMAFEA